jgi:hypothetical protein
MLWPKAMAGVVVLIQGGEFLLIPREMIGITTSTALWTGLR